MNNDLIPAQKPKAALQAADYLPFDTKSIECMGPWTA